MNFNNYLEIKTHAASIAEMCGRSLDDILILPVTKKVPIEGIQGLYERGVRSFGESKVQEALEKIKNMPEDISWHMIGTLQKNKVKAVVGRFALIHSVDSLELAEKISDASVEKGIQTEILLQVNTSGESTKHGFTSQGCLESFSKIAALQGVAVKGLMTMAPLSDDQVLIRKCFRSLRLLKETIVKQGLVKAGFYHLSMGMSRDYPLAIEEGATILRIGSAIFKP